MPINTEQIRYKQKNQTNCGIVNAVEYYSTVKKEKLVMQTTRWIKQNNYAGWKKPDKKEFI